jgi:hypothetical protein
VDPGIRKAMRVETSRIGLKEPTLKEQNLAYFATKINPFSPQRYLDLELLKKLPNKPYFFGLGWIQLRVNNDQRLHFWCPNLTVDDHDEDIHDHRYGFTSRILLGSLKQTFYGFIPSSEGKFELLETDCKPIHGEPKYDQRGDIIATEEMNLKAGDVYAIPHDQFHRIDATSCITLLTRGPIEKPLARVLKPWYQPHSCPLSKEMPQREIWDHIEQLLSDPALPRI